MGLLVVYAVILLYVALFRYSAQTPGTSGARGRLWVGSGLLLTAAFLFVYSTPLVQRRDENDCLNIEPFIAEGPSDGCLPDWILLTIPISLVVGLIGAGVLASGLGRRGAAAPADEADAGPDVESRTGRGSTRQSNGSTRSPS